MMIRKKVLMISWKDIKSPKAGGAEVLTYQVLKRLAKECDVTWISNNFFMAPKEESISGVKIVRVQNSIFKSMKRKRNLHGFLNHIDTLFFINSVRHEYKRRFKGRVDMVIDQINTFPFMTPLYVKEKKASLIHQLCGNVWFYESFFPINILGYFFEKILLLPYKKVPAITVSDSTKQDLEKKGFKDIRMIPEGIDFDPLMSIPEKEKDFTIIFVSRLTKMKRPDHLLKALKELKGEIPCKCWVIGHGSESYERRLRKYAEKHDLNVQFLGFVRESEKRDLMSRAHIIVMPSVREGWGLVVTESNALGTPALAYDVPGLRDSIVDGKTGVLVSKKSPKELSKAIKKLYMNPEFVKKLTSNALIDSKKYNWDNSFFEFRQIIEDLFSEKEEELIEKQPETSKSDEEDNEKRFGNKEESSFKDKDEGDHHEEVGDDREKKETPKVVYPQLKRNAFFRFFRIFKNRKPRRSKKRIEEKEDS